MNPSFARNKSNRSIGSNDAATPDASGGGGGPGDPETGAAPTSGGSNKKKPSRMRRLVNSARRRANGSLSSSLVRPTWAGGGGGGGGRTKGAKGAKRANTADIDESLGFGCNGMFSFIDEEVRNEVAGERERLREQRRMQPFRTFRPAPLREVAARLQADIEVRDRTFESNTYPHCFVGSEAVDYLVENELAPSRAQAVEVGRRLVASLGLFEHVDGGRDFEDAHLLYRFRAEDEFDAEGSLANASYGRLGSAGDRSAASALSGVSARSPIIKMDKYGFLLGDERCAADDGDSASADLARLRLSDAKRWENILEKVAPSAKALDRFPPNVAACAAAQSKVKHYARRGLPDGTRRRAWTVLTGVDLIVNESPGEYEALVDKADREYRKERDLNSAADLSGSLDTYSGSAGGAASRGGDVLDQIERDIRRTFPKHYLFHSKKDGEDKEGNRTRSLASASSVDPPSSYISDHDDYSDQEDDSSHADSDPGRDTIMEAATSTGQDPRGVVEAKKQLFNESMEMLTRSMAMEGGGLRNAESIGIARMHGSDRSLQKESTEGSDHSLDIFEEEDDDFAAGNSSFGGGRPSLGGGPASRLMATSMSTDALGVGRGQDALRRVLRAYSVYDNEVGYCQGMNFIAAMFLTFLTEEEAFWLLVVVMNEEPYELRELFGEDMAGTHEVLYTAEKLLGQFLPRLARHMEAEGVHVSMFVTQWLLTVYASTFPFELVSRVWDSFLVEGWKVVYRVMLALLEHASRDVLELRFEDILDYFRRLPSRVNGRTIMAGSLKIALKRKHIQRHLNEWRRHANGEGESTKSGGSSRRPAIRRRASDDHSSLSSGVFKSSSQSFGAFKSSSQSSGAFKTLASSGDMSFSKLAKDMLKKAPKEIAVEDLP